MPSHGLFVDVETLMMNHRNRNISTFDDQLGSLSRLSFGIGRVPDSIDQESVRGPGNSECSKCQARSLFSRMNRRSNDYGGEA
jgi:hypothetical protein